jgi:hypothetical protein
VDQKSLTNYEIRLKIINCQENFEANFIWWIHTSSFFILPLDARRCQLQENGDSTGKSIVLSLAFLIPGHYSSKLFLCGYVKNG